MTLRKTTILMLAIAAGVASGCGDEEEQGAPLPPDSAAALQRQLDSIQNRFQFPGRAACGDITGGQDPNTTPVQNTIDSLPDDVDPDVRDALQESFDRLFELVEQDCESRPEETESETEETPPPETETETETEETPPPEEDTETEETPPPEEELPEEELPPGQDGELPPGQGGENPGQGGGGGALVPGEDEQ